MARLKFKISKENITLRVLHHELYEAIPDQSVFYNRMVACHPPH